jgi:hypothetical protein
MFMPSAPIMPIIGFIIMGFIPIGLPPMLPMPGLCMFATGCRLVNWKIETKNLINCF